MRRFQSANLIPYDEVELLKSVKIGVAVWLGYGAVVMPGVELADGCIVAAGAVVTRSFHKGSIVGGNPAKIIKQRDVKAFDKLAAEEKYYRRRKRERTLRKNEFRVS